MTARFPGHGFLSLIPPDCTRPFYFGSSDQTWLNNTGYKTHYILDFIQCCFITQLNTAKWSHRTKGRLWLFAEGKNNSQVFCEKQTRFFCMLFFY